MTIDPSALAVLSWAGIGSLIAIAGVAGWMLAGWLRDMLAK